LTGLPAVSTPSDERRRVSPITSAVNTPSTLSMTVRQTPLTEIESPCRASEVTTGPRTAITAESPPASVR
jgi:hypothetical protein